MSERLKLNLKKGSFAVLAAGTNVNTCFTDYSGTSRSTDCTSDELIRFAEEILARFGRCAALVIVDGDLNDPMK